jgi:hypothetical protein
MQIVDIKEITISTGEKRSNAVMDFSDMTTGFVAVVTERSVTATVSHWPPRWRHVT